MESLPILVRRIARRVAPDVQLRIARPVRTPRQRVVRPRRLEEVVEDAASKTGHDGRILILLGSKGTARRCWPVN